MDRVSTPAGTALFDTIAVVNTNGGWCWFQDERTLVDPQTGTAVIGSVASPTGDDGRRRGGDVEVTVVDLAAGELAGAQAVLHAGFEADDHDNPALWRRRDRRWLAVYSRHKADEFTFWRLSEPGDPTRWGPEQNFCWTPLFGQTEPALPFAPGRGVTYQNIHPLDGQLLCFVRAVNDDPCYLVSDDDGDTWTFGGRLLTRPKIGYVNGYARYTSGTQRGTDDRIDLVITEHHPRDFATSIFHGYLAGGALHRTDGAVVGQLGRGVDDDTPRAEDLGLVFANGTVVDGQRMTHCWTSDIRRAADGRLVVLFTARTDDDLGLDLPRSTPDPVPHALLRAELVPGGAWGITKVCDMGAQLVPHETDYTGLASIDPDDPDALYVSTPIDPRESELLQCGALGVHEIFHGRIEHGREAIGSWVWTPVTENSAVDNYRPIAIPGDPDRRVLTWYRGVMRSSQDYDCEVVLAVGRR